MMGFPLNKSGEADARPSKRESNKESDPHLVGLIKR